MSFDLIERGDPDRVDTGVVSANFFDVLGIQPILGRSFVAADESHGAEAVLILSHWYWQSRFGGDPHIVGRVFQMNDRPHTVIGVLPAVPQYPRECDVYMPTSACPFRARGEERMAANRRAFGRLRVFGRLKPGVTHPHAAAQVALVGERFRRDYPEVYPDGQGFRRHDRRRAGGADAQRPPDAADAARRDGPRAADRVHERREPHRRAHAQSRSRAGDAHRARRQPAAPRRAAAHREPAARRRSAGPSASRSRS